MSKKFKKVLVVLLSALMVLTYMPATALTAFAANPEKTAYVVSPETIPDQEWAGGEDIDLSKVEELATIKADVYDGAAYSYGVELTRGTDYTVKSSTNQAQGAYVVFTGIGDYEGYEFENEPYFNIVETPAEATYETTIDPSAVVYDGEKTKAGAEEYVAENLDVMIIKNGLRKLLPREYEVTVKADSDTAKGLTGETYKVTVKVGEKTVKEETVTIAKRDLSKTTLTGEQAAAYQYNGDEQKATFTKIYANGVEVPAADYEITGYEDNVNVSEKAKALIAAKASSKNFTGTGAVKFAISQFNLGEGSTVRIMDLDPADVQSHEYDGKEFKPAVDVRAYFTNEPEAKRISPDDYVIAYAESSVDAGEYKVGIKAKKNNDNLYGETVSAKAVKAYVITPADLSKAVWTQKKDIIAGTAFSDLDDVLEYFTVTVNGIVLEKGKEYGITVTAAASAEPGDECEITLTGAADTNFTKSVKLKYTAVVKPFAALYTSNYNPTFNGELIKPFAADLLAAGIIDPDSEGPVTFTASDFDITGYENNKNAGTAIVNIQGKGNYLGQTSQIAFTIDPVVLNDDKSDTWHNNNTWDEVSYTNNRQEDKLTGTRTDYVWIVKSVSGLKDGTYCLGSIITGATVVLEKHEIVYEHSRTRVRTRNGYNWGNYSYTPSQNGWTDPEVASDTVKETVTLDATDFVLTASGFTTSGTQGKLTEVTVALTEDGKAYGNYTRESAFTYDTTALGIDANKVNLNNAEVTGSIPATLDADGDVTEAAIKENIKVTVDGIELSAGAYSVSNIAPTKAELGKTVSFRVEPEGHDEQVIGLKDATLNVEPVDISQFADAFAAVTVAAPADDPFVYTGKEHKPVVGSVEIADNIGGYPYVVAVENDTDYTLSYSNNIDAGTATVTFTGKGQFTGTATATFEISKADLYDLTGDIVEDWDDPIGFLADSAIYLDGVKEVEYKDGEVDDLRSKLSVKVVEGEKYVIDGTDYDIVAFYPDECPDYTEDTDHNPTSYIWYVIVAKETSKNYANGAIIPAYPVVRKQLNRSNVEITLKKSVFTVDDEDTIIEQADPTVKLGNLTLHSGNDYTVDVKGTLDKVEGEEGYEAPYLEFGFVNNYAGVVKMPIAITIDDTLDFEGLTLTVPPASALVYNGRPKRVMPHYIGTAKRPGYGTYSIVYKTVDGKELESAPADAGTYTATIKAAPAYGGQTYASVTFQIKPRKLSDTEFEAIAEDLFLGDVEYQAAFTKDPVIYDGYYWDEDEEEYIPTKSTDFEVVKADKEWDGEAATGKATVALKADSNLVYADSEVELEFFWEKGYLEGEPGDYYEIPDQEYTGEKLEPTEILAKEGWDLDPAWVTIKYYEGNDMIAGKTAKAFVEVTVPESNKYYGSKITGYITFNIKEHEATPEEAEHAAALVREDPEMPDSQKAKVAAATDALAAVLKDPDATAEEIRAAVNAVTDAVAEAYAYKAAYEDALAESIAALIMIGTGDYTDSTVTALTAAMEALNTVIDDPSATSGDLYKAATFLASIIERAELKTKGKIKKVTPAKKSVKAGKSFKLKAKKTTDGKVTFKKTKGNKKITVSKAGKVKVKKSLKKGTYKIKVKATAKATANYTAAKKTVSIKIKVK